MKKKNIIGIDVFKLIAAILIVILHCIGNYFGQAGELFKQNICCIAVPFFFITSGYFFGLGLNKKKNFTQSYFENCRKNYFIKYEKNLIKMYTAWSIIGIPFMIKLYYEIYDGNLLYIFLLMIRNVFFSGTFGIYWYILAMIGSSILIYFFVIKDKLKLMYFLSFVLFLFGVIYVGFQNSLGNNIIFYYLFKITWVIFSSERNFLMVGWFYMSIGYYFSIHKINIKMSTSILLFIVSMLLKFGESYLNTSEILNGNNICIMQSVQAIACFLMALNLKLNFLSGCSKIMRELSSTIYFTHFLFIGIINPYQIGNTAITFGIVLLLCFAFYFIIKKINNKKLNILINA